MSVENTNEDYYNSFESVLERTKNENKDSSESLYEEEARKESVEHQWGFTFSTESI